MEEQTYPHLLDVERQEVAWSVLGELTGTAGQARAQNADVPAPLLCA